MVINGQETSHQILQVVNRKELMILNHEKLLIKDNKSLSKTGVLVAKLKMKIKEIKNG